MENKTAFISIVGKPNVGKSSILNAIIKNKISIISKKPQTTRTKIMGILTENDVQLVFIDTPGIHKPKTALDKHMLKDTNSSIVDADIVLMVIEAGKCLHSQEIDLLNKLHQSHSKAILAINKIDLIGDKTILLKQITDMSQKFAFETIIPISAKKSDGLPTLVNELKKLAQPGERFFDDETITDQPNHLLFAEFIREKLLRYLDQEIPHGIAVYIEEIKIKPNGNINISVIIYCEKENHKGIIIGKSGNVLKKVGTDARHDIEKLCNSKVNLKLWVKVKDDWRNKENFFIPLVYNEEKEGF